MKAPFNHNHNPPNCHVCEEWRILEAEIDHLKAEVENWEKTKREIAREVRRERVA